MLIITRDIGSILRIGDTLIVATQVRDGDVTFCIWNRRDSRRDGIPSTNEVSVIKPSVGRAIWYYPSGKSQLDADIQPLAATIAFVHSDRLINIGYLTANGIAYSNTSVQLVQEGDEIPSGPFCKWMPFQLGQAKKYEAEAAAK